MKTMYDVKPIIDAFEEVKNHYGESRFRYKVETFLTGYHAGIIECFLDGKKKQFAFASTEDEPGLKDNEYWLVYYYELPRTSSTPDRGDKKNLKNNLIKLLEDPFYNFR
jgi:hypothetical protein